MSDQYHTVDPDEMCPICTIDDALGVLKGSTMAVTVGGVPSMVMHAVAYSRIVAALELLVADAGGEA